MRWSKSRTLSLHPSLTLGSFMYSFGVSNNGTFALVAYPLCAAIARMLILMAGKRILSDRLCERL